MAARWSAPRLGALVVLLALTSCKRGRADADVHAVPGIDLELPALPGWSPDPDVAPPGPGGGGTYLRLSRDQAVAGSPRIEVVIEPRAPLATRLETFIERNLGELRALERAGSIRIEAVAQEPTTVGPRRGWRVRHAYVLAAGEIAITQVSTFLVLDGRGVAVTAAGRTELFTPFAREIEAVLGGLRIPIPPGGDAPPADEPPAGVEPIDLGKLGSGG